MFKVGYQRPTFSFAHIQKVNYISLSFASMEIFRNNQK